MQLLLNHRPSPIGTMLLVWDVEGNLRALDFHDYEERMHRLLRRHYGTYELTNAQLPASIGDALDRYFSGDLTSIDTIKVATGGTPFQRQVWASLRSIQPGQPASYGGLAAQLGRATASRAVGLANGANPIAIVVPCHRVIGASGALTGYGGGLHRKRWLLEHEQRQPGLL